MGFGDDSVDTHCVDDGGGGDGEAEGGGGDGEVEGGGGDGEVEGGGDGVASVKGVNRAILDRRAKLASELSRRA